MMYERGYVVEIFQQEYENWLDDNFYIFNLKRMVDLEIKGRFFQSELRVYQEYL